MKIEESEKIAVCEKDFLFVERDIIIADEIVIHVYPYCFFDSIGIIVQQCSGVRRRQIWYISFFAIHITNAHHAINVFTIFMKAVVAEFIQYEKENHQAAGNANR